MTAIVLDAGALIALDRNDHGVWIMLRIAAEGASKITVPTGVIAQAWRDGRRQALLSRALAHATKCRSTVRSHVRPGCCAQGRALPT